MQLASGSANLNQIPLTLMNSMGGFIAIITSAFFGGFFAGLFTNYFESKRRIRDKRHDKYFEHRNTIVQIEQELIPLRVNLSRNISTLADAIQNTNDQNIRFILRFYKLSLSTGLSLRLLNVDLINQYAQLYSAIETFNSDVDYVTGMISTVCEDKKNNKIDSSIIDSYKTFLPYLKDVCEDIDQKSLNILIISKLAIGKEDKEIREKYLKDGKEIKYTFKKSSLKQKSQDIKKEEDPSAHKGEKQPKFISPFLDLKRVIINPALINIQEQV